MTGSKIFLVLIGLYFFLLFSSFHFGWAFSSYDEFRLITIVILIAISFYGVYLFHNAQRNEEHILSSKHYVGLFGLICITLVGAAVSSIHSIYSDFALSNLSLRVLLFTAGLSLYIIFRRIEDKGSFSNLCKFIFILAPVPTIILMLISVVGHLSGVGYINWMMNFEYVRYYDSTILIFIMLSFAFCLSSNNKFLKKIVYILSLLEVFSLFLDGARSALFSLVLSVVFVLIIYKEKRQEILRLVLVTGVSAIFYFMYVFCIHHIGQKQHVPLVRTDASGRMPLWHHAFDAWVTHPLLGVGGGTFTLDAPNLVFMHPHNFVLQMISGWGFFGIFYLIIIVFLAGIIYKNRYSINPFLFAGVVAVFIDSLFSGNMVYPYTQFLSLILFSYVLAKCPKKYNYVLPRKNILLIQGVMMSVLASSVLLMLVIHGQDFNCQNCKGSSSFDAPEFWKDGRSLHLVPNK